MDYLSKCWDNSSLSIRTKKTGKGICLKMFFRENLLNQFVHEPSHIPNIGGQVLNTLDRFLSSHHQIYAVCIYSPLCNSDHVLVLTEFSLLDEMVTNVPPKRKVWSYKHADSIGIKNKKWTCSTCAAIFLSVTLISVWKWYQIPYSLP